MAAIKLLKVMHTIGFLSPRAFLRFLSAVCRDGINLMLLLTIGAVVYGEKAALVAGKETLTYSQLKEHSETLAIALSEEYQLGKGTNTAFLCRSHAALIEALFAASRTGSTLYLLNPDMGHRQFDALAEGIGFDLVVYDEEFQNLVSGSLHVKKKLMSYSMQGPSVEGLAKAHRTRPGQLKRASGSRIVLLTGGTTGKPKKAVHRTSLVHFLNPFSELTGRLQLATKSTAYIATPIFHGYGIAILISLLALGKKVVIQERFEAGAACRLVHQHRVELITVVPVMIEKMLKTDPEKLASLTCIASGGAALNPKLVSQVQESLGDVLYNLYGTSEAGLNIIATPQDLAQKAETVGKSLRGTHIKVFENGVAKKTGEIGQLCVRNGWSMKNRKSGWLETGDLGYQDEEGYYFLCGRTDDLIISGGTNIYPAEIEQALRSHPLIEEAAVVGVPDERYGASVKAFIQPVEGSALTQEALAEWLQPMLGNYQLPRSIEFRHELPYTDIGKLDKKLLKKTGETGE